MRLTGIVVAIAISLFAPGHSRNPSAVWGTVRVAIFVLPSSTPQTHPSDLPNRRRGSSALVPLLLAARDSRPSA